MRLYKVDTSAWAVRELEGEPWPGKDSDGERCFDNTHFADANAAWEKLEAEALAYVEIATRALTTARDEVATRERDAADAASALEQVRHATEKMRATSPETTPRLAPPSSPKT